MASSKRTPAPPPAPSSRPEEEAPQAQTAPAPSRAELAVAFSKALDLAEGRPPGHAARVCYIALNLAWAVDLPPAGQRVAFYAALLHDAGAAPASAETCRLLNLSEEAVFAGRPGQSPQQLALQIAPSNATQIVDVLRAHLELGALVARNLGFETEVQEAIAAHHERWDGQGYPHARKEEAVPAAARLVAAADLIESLISAETNPLSARRNLTSSLSDHAGRALDPELAARARDLVRSDTFWLGLHNGALPQELASAIEDADERGRADLRTFGSVFANLADTKGEHTARHSERTAALVETIAEELDFDERHRELVYLAALLHDVGLLGVPARVIAKPDILSLTEMEAMRKHPSYSQMVLEALPGLEEVARWMGAHHERPDGRGYPEMLGADHVPLGADHVPLEARIIALADTYVALTSSRPYRRALSPEDAQQVLLGGAGTQLDRRLVQELCARSEPELTSSRSAPRSQRTR